MTGGRTVPAAALERAFGVLVFLTALGVRVVYLSGPQPPIIPYADAYNYWGAGHGLLAGRLSPTDWGVLATRGPVYPALLAVLFGTLGDHVEPIRWLQALFGAATCWLVYEVTRELATPAAALVAGILTAACPGLVLQTGEVHTETLAVFLLWLGLWLLVRSRRLALSSSLWCSGLVVALACLTRVTLMPLIPFLIGAMLAAPKPAAWRERGREVAVLAAALLLPILAWAAVAGSQGPSVTTGPRGLESMLRAARGATDSAYRGWPPDDLAARERSEAGSDIAPPLMRRGIAAASLVLTHLWFSDNLWRQPFFLSPAGMDVWQRVSFVLGLCGLGLAFCDGRRFAPILAVLAGLLPLSVKWIEIRHTLPFLPALFVLAGVFVSGLTERLRESGPLRRLLVVGVVLIGLVALWFSRWPTLAARLSDFDGTRVGQVGDATILAIAASWGILLFWLWRPERTVRAAAVVGLLPAGLFMLFFAAYAYTQPVPRWRAQRLALSDPGLHYVQEIRLTSPLEAGRIEAADWLVDLESIALPKIEAWTNGNRVTPSGSEWAPLDCSPTDPCRLLAVYRQRSLFAGRPVSGWPQWWRLPVDPTVLAGTRLIWLSLAARPGAMASLGLIVQRAGPREHEAPSLRGTTSLYRWVVAEDWRIWERTPLSSQSTVSRIVPETGALLSASGRHDVRFSVRLRVRYKDGTEAVY